MVGQYQGIDGEGVSGRECFAQCCDDPNCAAMIVVQPNHVGQCYYFDTTPIIDSNKQHLLMDIRTFWETIEYDEVPSWSTVVKRGFGKSMEAQQRFLSLK